MRIAHVSDPHFGRIACPHVQEDLIESLRAHRCAAVLITGDLTQRARRSEFKAACSFLDSLPQPWLVIPGNHDVHAWWHHPELRLFNPLHRYKQRISRELESQITIPGLAILGLNTAHGLTIKSGRCTFSQAQQVLRYFTGQPQGTLKILAVHHPLAYPATLPHSGRLDVALRGKEILKAAAQSGVHVVCAGHWHLGHFETFKIERSRFLVSLAGTATSDRWRAPQWGINSWNLIQKSSDGIEGRIFVYDRKARCFETYEQIQSPFKDLA